MPESGENRSMLGQTLASELQIKVYKEISAWQHDISETVDSILMTCNEPGCCLTEAELLAAKERDSSSGIVEYFSQRPGLSAAIISIAAASICLVIFMLKNKS